MTVTAAGSEGSDRDGDSGCVVQRGASEAAAQAAREHQADCLVGLGGGIAIQHRMAFQGEYFVQRYGATEAQFTPPVTDMLAADVPVGAGTDATRVASFNPWVSLYWLVSGRTFAGQMFGYRLGELGAQIGGFGAQLWLAFLAIGIGLQNAPEGLAVVDAFLASCWVMVLPPPALFC